MNYLKLLLSHAIASFIYVPFVQVLMMGLPSPSHISLFGVFVQLLLQLYSPIVAPYVFAVTLVTSRDIGDYIDLAIGVLVYLAVLRRAYKGLTLDE